MLAAMRQPHASGGRWRNTSWSLQSLDGPGARMLLIGLDAMTWIYVVIVVNRALG